MLARGRAPSADQQDAERALSARLDLQADGRDGAARGRHRSRTRRSTAPAATARQPLLRLPRRARPDEPAPRDRRSCNTYFYTMGRRIGIDRIAAMCAAARARPALRPAGRLAKLRHDPRSGLEAAPLPPGLEPGRHAQHRDRPGLCDRQSAAAGGHGGAHRLGPRHPAAPDPPNAQPPAAPLPFAAGHFETVRVGHGRGGERRRHRRRAAACPSRTSRWPARPAPRRSATSSTPSAAAPAAWHYRDHGLFVFFAPVGAPALRRRGGDRARPGRRPRRGAGRQGRAHLSVRQGQGDGSAAAARGRAGAATSPSGWTRRAAALGQPRARRRRPPDPPVPA